MPRRRIVLVKFSDGDPSGEMCALGTVESVLAAFGRVNTATDRLVRSPPDESVGTGGGLGSGVVKLHGPGLTAEVPTTNDLVQQSLVTITDEDYAFSVLTKLCKAEGWAMMDPESGRTFSVG